MATRIKAKTLPAVPQSKNDCAAAIATLGDLTREFERERAEMNDAIADITKLHQPTLAALEERMQAIHAGVLAWCAAHRTELCGENDRLGKTANLVTGEVSWRIRPPSVTVRGLESVLDTLARMGMSRFIRTKSEVNKEAILNDPEAVRGIAGLTVVSGVEDFIVVPFEQAKEAA